ncbi:MAG: hypothetical protein KDA91_23705 [Planctomycetaceae bacterium]|nr:hypothetical protein [Planctomycetaceae bacterium]
MRIPLMIVTCFALGQTGCSTLIARSGTELWTFKSIEEVHAVFGNPIEIRKNESGTTETYRTRRKLAEPSNGYGMEFVMLWGTREPKNTWTELSKYGRTILASRRVEFRYDNQGNVSSWSAESGFGD